MRLERRQYREIPAADLVIRLTAPIETTLLRDERRTKREGPDPDALRRRRDLETGFHFAGVPVVDVNTDRHLGTTLADVMFKIWSAL